MERIQYKKQPRHKRRIKNKNIPQDYRGIFSLSQNATQFSKNKNKNNNKEQAGCGGCLSPLIILGNDFFVIEAVVGILQKKRI